jgi:DnaJ-class molecular chaperone
MAKRDYYDVLGVSKTASQDEIRKAHRKLVMKYHPDRNKGDAKTEEKFKEVQEAYDVLSDQQKRQNYDQFGFAGVGAGGPAGGGGAGVDPFEAFRRAQAGANRGRQQRWQAGPGVSVEDFDTGGFGDIFEQLFGARPQGRSNARGGRNRAREAPPSADERGADVEYPVTLTFEQAARGTTLPLQINREGRLETIDIKIPPGVKDGSRVRIRGKGHPGLAEPGDLYIITHVTPHAYYRREEQDIYLDLPISLYEALLGAKVEVPTLDGPVTLTIPPGTSGDTRLRIANRGIERSGQRGHQYVVPKIIVPKELTPEDLQAVEQLARKHPINARADVPWRNG